MSTQKKDEDPNQVLIQEMFLDTLPTEGKGPRLRRPCVQQQAQQQQTPQPQPQAQASAYDRFGCGQYDVE